MPHTGDFDIQIYAHLQMCTIERNKLAPPTLLQLPPGTMFSPCCHVAQEHPENLMTTIEVLMQVGIHSRVVRFADDSKDDLYSNICAAFLDISQVGAPNKSNPLVIVCPMVGVWGAVDKKEVGDVD